MSKVSEIAEKQIVSIMGGSVIVSKLDQLFLLVSKTGITTGKEIPKELDFNSRPSSKEDLFNMVSCMDTTGKSFDDARISLHYKDEINKRIVLEEV